jgi:flagellar P-ring protein precursor FlgI
MAAALRLMYNPVTGPDELKDMNNVALVMIEAKVPAHGVRRGQKLDCHVSAIGGAKSLRGGRLLLSPLGSQLIDDERVMGLASGGLALEDAQSPTTARIAGGVVAMQDVVNLFVRDNKFRLLLDHSHSSFQAASDVALAVNSDASFEASGKKVARATGPGVVEVDVPEQYRHNTVQFVAQVLNVGLETPHTQARVVVNTKTGVIVVTGEVEISPVVISHKNLSVAIGVDPNAPPAPAPEPVPGVGFVPVVDQSGRQSPQKLQDLVQALNQLKVPTGDVIDIIRELHRTGKLHAVLITE